jgi:hypothetical protein
MPDRWIRKVRSKLAELANRLPEEAAMIGTLLVSVAALIIAILGCALVKPVEATKRHHDAIDDDWTRDNGSRNRAVAPQEH